MRLSANVVPSRLATATDQLRGEKWQQREGRAAAWARGKHRSRLHLLVWNQGQHSPRRLHRQLGIFDDIRLYRSAPERHRKYGFCLYRVRINVNYLRKYKYFSNFSVCNRIKYTEEMKCIDHIILWVVSEQPGKNPEPI